MHAPADVRFGSKADIGLPAIDIRYTPKSGHRETLLGCLLCANKRYLAPRSELIAQSCVALNRQVVVRVISSAARLRSCLSR
jgi:hypothetical protein